MRTTILFCALLIAMVSTAQNISNEQLKKIRSDFKKDAYTKAMQNALSSNEITNLAWNRENEGTTDHFFKYKVNVSGITNQKKSGRCWLFTSLNVFRPMASKKFNMKEFEYSENYLYFYDILEKSNLFLENIVATANLPLDDEKVRWYFRSPADDGGQWINFVNLAVKYGMIPKDAMEETNSSDNTAWMIKLIKRKLREDALELREMLANKNKQNNIEQRKSEMLSEVYRMLALNLGEPPTEFNWRYKDKDDQVSEWKKYTPVSFMNEVFGDLKLTDFVMLMNDPSRPFWKHYEIENYRNTTEGENWHYVNLPNEEIKKFCIESIKNNDPMYTSSDVAKQLRRDYGVLDIDNFDFESVYGVSFGMNKTQRIQTSDSGSSHAMTLIAVDVDENETPLKWQFENSWGTTAGKDGYLTFTDDWFNEYMFRIVVNKKYVSDKVLEIYKQKPTMLPPWDPMF